jgi:hypothetical protein
MSASGKLFLDWLRSKSPPSNKLSPYSHKRKELQGGDVWLVTRGFLKTLSRGVAIPEGAVIAEEGN